MKNRAIFIQVLTICIALFLSYHFGRNGRMSDNWMGPYLSGAENLEWGGSFLINLEEVNFFQNLNVNEQDQYQFRIDKNLVHYNHNPIGYAYLIKFSTLIFPFVGDQLSIILFQCLVFIGINILFLTIPIFSTKQKWLFFVLFSINPLVLRFVPFNFYYFWQLIPSVLFCYLMLSKSPNKLFIGLLLIFLPFVVLTRPTLVFTLIFIFYLIYRLYGLISSFFLLAGTIIIIGILFQPTKKNIWHTVYTGIGAYSNKYKIQLSDNDAYALYEKETGIKLEASVGGNYYNEPIIDQYTQITKKVSLSIFKEFPFLFLKNAVINSLQGYSIGYVNKGGDLLNYFISLTGLAFIALLIFFKKNIWFLFIACSIGTFTLYYPPVQAYMYGVYLILVINIITILPELRRKVKWI